MPVTVLQNKKRFAMARYITTTLPYVNADPHIGHAIELLYADVLARAARGAGEDVFFNTGSDEHGQKIFQAAEKAGQDVQTYVDHYAARFDKLKEALNLSYDNFIRTTDTRHVAAAQEMWRRCAHALYKKSYTGFYCVGCEAYKTEKEIENGECPLHPGTKLEKITEENYFFKFSAYQDRLRAYLRAPHTVIPRARRNEALAFIERGLEDFSVSRERARVSWGIPVPGDESQVMYVWFDALTNYLSTLGWPHEEGAFQKFWVEGETLQLAGKDQVRFQSLMWQAMLMAADIKNTDRVFYHGFITSGGQKMSKSFGNVISPYDLVGKYGTEAARYILLRHVHPTEDTDITEERMDEWYTANLVNGLGNLVARVMTLAAAHLSEPDFSPLAKAVSAPIRAHLDNFLFNQALDYVWEAIRACDELITHEEPFKKIKTQPQAARETIREAVRRLGDIARDLVPFMPATAEKITAAVRKNEKPENLFPRLG